MEKIENAMVVDWYWNEIEYGVPSTKNNNYDDDERWDEDAD